MSMLSVQNINTGYGKKQVLFDVNLEVQEGETVLLIGANGSGKSTLFKAIYGLLPLWSGGVSFDGNDITNCKTHSLIEKGIMYIPQKDELFEDMTVEQNLYMVLLYLNNKRESQKRIEKVFDQLNILKLKRKQVANQLSGGERKLLSLGMVLMNRPKLLLYDEPLAGLSGVKTSIVLKQLQQIKKSGTTLVVIEHRIKDLLSLTDRVVGLKLGERNTEKLNNLETIKSFMI